MATTSASSLAVAGMATTASAQSDTSASTVMPASNAFGKRPKLALNTSTIRGQKLTVDQQIRVTADAGFDGIEPWIRDLRRYVDEGGKVATLKSMMDDFGLECSGAIGFARWIVDDAKQRSAGLDEARRDMELVRSLGGRFIAAPPIGVARESELAGGAVPPLDAIAERYAALLDVGDQVGVTPLLELWGFSKVLSTLGELAYVATAASHSSAAVLPDFYHIYKGGNSMTSLAMIEASRMPLFHINDYPAQPAIDSIADKDRVYPGDGVCPLVDTIAMLLRHGFRGTFSLELFNSDYWKQPALDVAQQGHMKSQAVVDAALKKANAST